MHGVRWKSGRGSMNVPCADGEGMIPQEHSLDPPIQTDAETAPIEGVYPADNSFWPVPFGKCREHEEEENAKACAHKNVKGKTRRLLERKRPEKIGHRLLRRKRISRTPLVPQQCRRRQSALTSAVPALCGAYLSSISLFRSRSVRKCMQSGKHS